MQSSRRGFLGLVAGAAAAGPSGAAKAASKMGLGALASSIKGPSKLDEGLSSACDGSPDFSWTARDLYRILTDHGNYGDPSIVEDRIFLPVDLQQLKSVSLSVKAQIQQRRQRQRNIEYSIKKLVSDGELKVFPGMTDDAVFKAVKKLAGY